MAAQLGDRCFIDADAHIVNPGPSGSRDFPRRRDQPVAELARSDEGDVALRRARALVMGIAGKGERRIRQQENEAAMGDAIPVDHLRLDRHRQDGFACLDPQDLHAETLAGVVFLPHRIRAGAREIVGRKRGLDVHCVLPGRAGLVGTSLLNCAFSRLVMMRSHHGVNDPCGRQIAFEIAKKSGLSMLSGAKKSDGPPVTVEVRCVRLPAKADDPASLAPAIERRPLSRAANEVLIEVKAAAVNPSDVKAATGLMAYAVFPRTPGRDYAGVVIDGPPSWIGREVFGSSGDLGIRRDGTHATHLAVEADAVVEKPKNLSWDEAAGIGVPFVTAMEGFRRAGMPTKAETVLVMGVNGKVGQAAVQIASWHGARVIGVVRKNELYEGHANSKIDVIDASVAGRAAWRREIPAGPRAAPRRY